MTEKNKSDRTVGDLLATFVQRADPQLAADLRTAAHSGCCDCCNGTGADAACEGDCSDCMGTGCAHADPCVTSPAPTANGAS